MSDLDFFEGMADSRCRELIEVLTARVEKRADYCRLRRRYQGKCEECGVPLASDFPCVHVKPTKE